MDLQEEAGHQGPCCLFSSRPGGGGGGGGSCRRQRVLQSDIEISKRGRYAGFLQHALQTVLPFVFMLRALQMPRELMTACF